MRSELIWIFFFCFDDENSFFRENIFLIQGIENPDSCESDEYRVECREKPNIEDNQSRNFFLEKETRRKIDKSNINQKPEKTPTDNFSYRLEHRFVGSIVVEFATREYDTPE